MLSVITGIHTYTSAFDQCSVMSVLDAYSSCLCTAGFYVICWLCMICYMFYVLFLHYMLLCCIKPAQGLQISHLATNPLCITFCDYDIMNVMCTALALTNKLIKIYVYLIRRSKSLVAFMHY